MERTLKYSLTLNRIRYLPTRKGQRIFTFSVLFSWQALHLCSQMRIVKCFATAKREIICYRILWNISLRSMWNEINPLTPAGISLAVGKFHARSAFHKSRKGFISLRSAPPIYYIWNYKDRYGIIVRTRARPCVWIWAKQGEYLE